jgi:8-oxo-dGTP pyrophosphatase MutT (NUDIX family)
MTSLPIDRSGARVLLVDSGGRVLLLHGLDPSDPAAGSWWCAPGGGREARESLAECAVRELAEETGLVIAAAELGEPIYEQVVEFSFEGASYRQNQVFYLVRVGQWALDDAGWTDGERRSLIGHRWWTAAEIAESTEKIHPVALPGLLTGALGSAVMEA